MNCPDCGIPKREAIKRKGVHGETCQSEGRINIAWGIATCQFDRDGDPVPGTYRVLIPRVPDEKRVAKVIQMDRIRRRGLEMG